MIFTWKGESEVPVGVKLGKSGPDVVSLFTFL
jgi:hypothetical protein